MPKHTVSPRFSGWRVSGRRPQASLAAGQRSPTKGRRRRPRSGSFIPTSASRPQYVAEDLLRAEGFTEIRYVPSSGGFSRAADGGSGEIDFGSTTAAALAFHLDAGEPITALAGVHSGCYELFAHEPIRTIGDLKGKRVGIQTLSSSGHLYLSIMAAHVGLDPQRDIEWVTSPDGNAMELFAEGKVDAFLGFPPSRRSCAPARSVA